jgi:Ricin-type beta-trefoil lectin domain-like
MLARAWSALHSLRGAIRVLLPLCLLALLTASLASTAHAAPRLPARSATPAAAAGPRAISNVGKVYLRNYHSGLCLAETWNATDVWLDQESCGALNREQWNHFYSNTLGAHQFQNDEAGGAYCISARDTTAEGAYFDPAYCHGEWDHAQWFGVSGQFVNPDGTKSYQFRNRHTGKCLAVEGASQSPYAYIVQYTCHSTGDHSQMWTLYPA